MKKLIPVLVVVVSLLLCTSMLTSCACGLGSIFEQEITVMECGEITVTKPMMTFFFNEYVNDWYKDNTQSMFNSTLQNLTIMVGVTEQLTTGNMKEQKITEQDVLLYAIESSYVGGTWYDFFSEKVIEMVEGYVIRANAANEMGITLSVEEQDEIDDKIDELLSTLDEQGLKLSDVYGRGVTEDDVRKCYELKYLAAAVEEYNREQIESSINGKDATLFREDHKENYYFAKCLAYSINFSENDMPSREEYYSAVEDAYKAIDEISKAKDAEEFLLFIEKYGVSYGSEKKEEVKVEYGTGGNFIINGTVGGFVSGTGESVKVEYSTAIVLTPNVEGGFVIGTSKPSADTSIFLDKSKDEGANPYEQTVWYSTDGELAGWLFDNSDNVEYGDVYVIDESGFDSKIKADAFSATVYMAIALPNYDETFTHDFAYVITDSEDAANAVLKDLKALAYYERNGDEFMKIAEEHLNEISSSDNAKFFGFDNVKNGKGSYFNQAFDDLNKWIESDDRMGGDFTSKIIEITANFKTYYAVLYYDGDGMPAWYADVLEDMTAEELGEWYKQELRRDHVNFDMEAFESIEIVRQGNSGNSILDTIFDFIG